MENLIQRSPADNPVFAFMDKKRAQGKPYFVYMTAGANKFLRIYYGKVNAFLSPKDDVERKQAPAEAAETFCASSLPFHDEKLMTGGTIL